MRALVTGGTGFIGSRLVERLCQEGHSVVNVDVKKPREFMTGMPWPSSLATWEEADCSQISQMKRLFVKFKPQWVFHLAAIHFIPHCEAFPQEVVESNISGLLGVLEGCKLEPPDQFVFVSSNSVYKSIDGKLREDGEVDPDDFYGLSKLTGEMMTRLWARRIGMPAKIMRLFNVFGPNDPHLHLIPAILKQVIDGEKVIQLGNLNTKRDFIFVSDVVEAILSLLQKDVLAIVNVGTGMPYSARDLVKYMRVITGIELECKETPLFVRKHDPLCLSADILKISSQYGWHPRVGIGVGLEKTMAAMKTAIV